MFDLSLSTRHITSSYPESPMLILLTMMSTVAATELHLPDHTTPHYEHIIITIPRQTVWLTLQSDQGLEGKTKLIQMLFTTSSHVLLLLPLNRIPILYFGVSRCRLDSLPPYSPLFRRFSLGCSPS